MKNFIISVVFCLALCGFSFAQSRLPELDKIRQIKLLESTREDVKRIFADYKFSDLGELGLTFFPTKNTTIYTHYASGNCSEEDEEWNVQKGKITDLIIGFKKSIKTEDLGVNLTKLTKEQSYINLDDEFVYHDKNAGIGYYVVKDRIRSIDFIPSKERYSFLCNKKSVKNFYYGKSWFHKKLKKRKLYRENSASVNELTLSANEIIANCDSSDLTNKSCADSVKLIEVFADAESSDEYDILTYNYTISGGKIIGNGEKVTWDLSGVKPGTYKITASVDNGCGVCGTTRTQEVVIKDCPDCSKKIK